MQRCSYACDMSVAYSGRLANNGHTSLSLLRFNLFTSAERLAVSEDMFNDREQFECQL